MTPEYNPYKVASFQLTDDWLACCIEKARIDSMDLSMPEAVRAINQNNINYDLILSRNETLVGAMLRLPPRSTVTCQQASSERQSAAITLVPKTILSRIPRSSTIRVR